MLQNIRDKLQSHKWLSYSVLAILALMFAVWGAYGMIELGTVDANTAAEVDGRKISREEVLVAWQNQLPRYLEIFGGDLSDEQRRRLQEDLLDGFIRNAAVLARAEKLGFRVTREQIRQGYQQEPAFQIDGNFSQQAAYAALAAAGVTPQQYEADLRRRLVVNQLGGAIGGTSFITPSEAARLFVLQAEEREVRYVLFPYERFSSGPAFDDGTIEAAYKANEAQYTEPESVHLAYAELTLADVAAQITVTDEQLRERYEAEKDRFNEPERRHARHILIGVDEGKDDADARARAQALAERARAGEDFAKLARENSTDQGSAGQGGDLGWADRSVFPEPFANALFALEAGGVSEPVKTTAGWHVIKLEGVEPGRTRTFEEARDDLEAELRQQLAADEFGNRQELLQQRIERGVNDLDPLVEAFGLRRAEIPEFARGAGAAPLGSDAALNREVFSEAGRQGRVIGPLALGDDHLLAFKVLEYRPARVKPLEQVREQVIAQLARERGVAAARQAAEAALPRLQAGEDLGKIASSLKLTAEPASFVSRGDPVLPVEVRDVVFNARRPQAGSPLRTVVPMEDGAALVEVTATRVPEGELSAMIGQQIAQREIERRGGAEVDAYLVELMRRADIEKNPQVFE